MDPDYRALRASSPDASLSSPSSSLSSSSSLSAGAGSSSPPARLPMPGDVYAVVFAPPGARPRDVVSIDLPSGQSMETVIPDGVFAGMQFRLRVPAHLSRRVKPTTTDGADRAAAFDAPTASSRAAPFDEPTASSRAAPFDIEPTASSHAPHPAPPRPPPGEEDGAPLSGHGWSRKARLASAYIPIALGFVSTYAASVMYTLKLDDPANIGWMQLVQSAMIPWTVLCCIAAGHLQDKEMLDPPFPRESWGRRAPWFDSCAIGAGASLWMMFAPPRSVQGGPAIYGWWALCLMLYSWFSVSQVTAVLAAVVEIYPSKDERVVVRAWISVMTCVGLLSGLCVLNIVLIAETSSIGTMLGPIVFLACVILRVPAIGPLRDACQPADPLLVDDSLYRTAVNLVLHRPAVRIQLCATVVDAARASVTGGLALWYLKFVSGLSDKAAGEWTSITFGLGFAASAACAPLLGWHFSRTGAAPQDLAVVAHVADAFLWAIGLLSSTSVVVFAGVFVVHKLIHTTWDFHNLCAFGWAIDEDVQKLDGRRRESTIWALSMVCTAGGMLVGNSAQGIMGFIGLPDDGAQNEQTESLRTYLRFIYGVVVPLLVLLQAYFIRDFPIRGDRALEIEQRTASAYRVPDPDRDGLDQLLPPSSAAANNAYTLAPRRAPSTPSRYDRSGESPFTPRTSQRYTTEARAALDRRARLRGLKIREAGLRVET